MKLRNQNRINVPIYVGREASKRSGRYDTTAKEAPIDRAVTCLNGIPDIIKGYSVPTTLR